MCFCGCGLPAGAKLTVKEQHRHSCRALGGHFSGHVPCLPRGSQRTGPWMDREWVMGRLGCEWLLSARGYAWVKGAPVRGPERIAVGNGDCCPRGLNT